MKSSEFYHRFKKTFLSTVDLLNETVRRNGIEDAVGTHCANTKFNRIRCLLPFQLLSRLIRCFPMSILENRNQNNRQIMESAAIENAKSNICQLSFLDFVWSDSKVNYLSRNQLLLTSTLSRLTTTYSPVIPSTNRSIRIRSTFSDAASIDVCHLAQKNRTD